VAELVWLVSHQNILEMLSGVCAERQRRVVFEELVKEPERVMRELSGWLGLEYEAGMIEPYEERGRRMTDGVYAEGKMLGDIKFHEHGRIEEGVGERWRRRYKEEFVSEETWVIAEGIGYERRRWGIYNNGTGEPKRYDAEALVQEDALALSPILPADGNGSMKRMLAQVEHLSDAEVDVMLDSLLSGESNA
jgi:hypothetical protein